MKNVNKSLLFELLTIVFACFAIYFVSDAFAQMTVGSGGILIATVVGGLYTPDMVHYRKLISKKVNKEIWYKGKMSKLLSVIDYDKFEKTGRYAALKDSPMPNGGIINLIRDFKSKKGVEMDIPMIRPLTGHGKIGSARLKGTGEARKIFNQKVAINLRRHAVTIQDNDMSVQSILEDTELATMLFEDGANDLKDWFSRLMPFEYMFGLFNGYSENIYDSVNGLGTNYARKSHPNFYVQGSGLVATPATMSTPYTFNAAYETQCKTALATLAAETSTTKFKYQSLRNMKYLAVQKKIAHVLFNGMEVHFVFITESQAWQLKSDPEWISLWKDAAARAKDNPAISGIIEGYIVDGLYICVDPTIPSAYIDGDAQFVAAVSTTGATTGVQYGGVDSDNVPSYMEDPRDTGPRKPAILLGKGAIHVGEGRGFVKTEEVDDHDQWIEHGGKMIYGVARADIIDADNYLGNGAGLFYANQSSLLYWTYSPDSITV